MSILKLKIKWIMLMTALILTGCASRLPSQPVVEPPADYLKNIHPRVALVLGSGSARGFAHAGVLKALEDNHVPIDLIVGTSAGSIVGALYAGNPSAKNVQHILLTAKKNKVMYFSWLNLFQGPIGGENLQRFINENIAHTTFDQLSIPLLVVATDLASGEKHVFKSGPVAPAVNASAAAPLFFRPVRIYGKTFIDGAIVDPVPVDVAKKFRPKIIIAVNLNYKMQNDIPTSGPMIFLRSFNIMISRLNDLSSGKATVVIQPKTGNLDMFDDKERAHSMQQGEIAALKMMPEIKRQLKKYRITVTRK